MKRLGTLLLVLLISSISFAQYNQIRDRRLTKKVEYLFHVGDTIMFFPVNPDYNGQYNTDYPCFYDIICLDKGIKPKYRFAANKQKLTPKSEIENTYFCVKKICDGNFNKENKLAYSAVLERVSDHTQICFAFPSDLRKEKESILNAWLYTPESIGYIRPKSSIVIPYLEKWFIDKMNSLEGKTLLLKKYYEKDMEDFLMLKFANDERKAERLVNVLSKIKEGDNFTAGKMKFISWGNKLVYSQPYLSITDPRDDYMYRVPVTHFAGNSNHLFIIKGEIEELPRRHFVEKETYIANLREKQPRQDSLIGRIFYFDTNNYYYKEVKGNIRSKIIPVDNQNELYNLTDGYYKCVGFDCFPDKYSMSFFTYCAILEDNTGKRFTFPASFEYKKYGRREYINFTKAFMPKADKEEKDRKEAQDEANKKRLIAKYGEDVGFAIWVGKCTEERYAALCKKYGKKKAGWMARHIYDIGWTYNEFCEAKNPIVKFECIHTYENKYAYYEVYNYGGTYITFKNSVIVSISDYMGSDF